MDSAQKIDEMEVACHKLEEEKFSVERDLINTRDIAQKLDARKTEAENEIKRLNAAIEKVFFFFFT